MGHYAGEMDGSPGPNHGPPNDCTVCHRAPGIWRCKTYPEFYACDNCMEKTFEGLRVSNGARNG